MTDNRIKGSINVAEAENQISKYITESDNEIKVYDQPGIYHVTGRVKEFRYLPAGVLSEASCVHILAMSNGKVNEVIIPTYADVFTNYDSVRQCLVIKIVIR